VVAFPSIFGLIIEKAELVIAKITTNRIENL
jgi:hypothetical protein